MYIVYMYMYLTHVHLCTLYMYMYVYMYYHYTLTTFCFYVSLQLRMSEEAFRLRLTPLEMIMKRLLTRLAAKDPADIFAEPVPLDDVRE